MYENDNFSGYETGDENTTGTFSGVSAAGSANGYTTYQMGGSTGSNTEPKKTKKQGGYFRKAMVSVSLGLFFGLFAGIGFYAVQQGTGMLKTGTDTAVVDEVASEAATESSQSTPQLATNVTYVESDVSDVVEKVMPAMVSIVNNFTETANVFGQQYTQEEAASGSGIIVGKTDDELLIVSNNHVVESADTLTVTFIDGSEAQAQVKGLDSDMDLAVIAVSLNDLSDDTKNAITVATLGSSDDLKLGEPVIAIGNALGYGQSVTNGIVSALNREITLENGATGTFIQTNAAINPGNSGGGLFNGKGELIGVVVAKSSGSGIEGLGFAIPINTAKDLIDQIMEYGYVKGRIDLGFTTVDVTNAQTAMMYRLSSTGVYIDEVTEGSNAAAVGFRAGDRILSFNGEEIASGDDLTKAIQNCKVGDTVEIIIVRNGQKYSGELTLEESKPAAAN